MANRAWPINRFDTKRRVQSLPTTASAAAAYASPATLTVRQLIATLGRLPPEAANLPVVYMKDGWRHRIQDVRVTMNLKGSEVELSQASLPGGQ